MLCGVWELKAADGLAPQCFAPDGCAELVVHLSGVVTRSLHGRALAGASYSLAHPISGGIEVAQSGPIHIRALRFRPAGLFALGLAPERVRNLVVEPEPSLGAVATVLQDLLINAADLAGVMQGLEDRLGRTVRQVQAVPVFTGHALRQMALDPSERALERLTGWTARHTRRLMLRETGYTPSEFQRVAQFHQARALIETSSLSLAEIAARTGYADQAHMSHRVKNFSGLSPAALRKAGLSQAGSSSEPFYSPDQSGS